MLKPCCTFMPCAVMGGVMMVLLTLTELAAIMGVYIALFGFEGASYGTSNASFALIALGINTAIWTKYGQMHCPGACGKKA